MNSIAPVSAASIAKPSDFEVAIRLAIEIFGNCGETAVGFDPEWPQEKFVTVRVVGRGDVQDVIARELQWHARLEELLPDVSDEFRLLIDYKG